MNHEYKITYSSDSCETNNIVIDDQWNDTSESETIDELPRLSIESNDGSITNSRRVSFPKSDNDLVTGYLEPANPWESACEVKSINELKELYEKSCKIHNTEPLTAVLNHLQTLELNKTERHTSFSLKNTKLTPASCEALEEIFKRVQYESIDLSACNLNDVAGSALFDMIEYYEATNELDISDNPDISFRGWQSCISMIRKSRALQILIARGIVLSELNATSLGKSLNQSCLHTIKLEHCGLTGRPLASLCNNLRKNTTLKELWIAYNDLSDTDAEKLADLLKANAYLEFLDISNNNIKDIGVKQIVIALIKQSTNLQTPKDDYELNFNNSSNNISNCNSNNCNNCNDNNDNSINNDNNNMLKNYGITSGILCKESNNISSKNVNNENLISCTNDLSSSTSAITTSKQNVHNNVGRSMLDTLLNMNTKEIEKNTHNNYEITPTVATITTTNIKNLNDNIDDDDKEKNNKFNENNSNIIINSNNVLKPKTIDCDLINKDNCELMNNAIQDDNSCSTISGSLTPTPPFNIDSSFSDENLLQNDKSNNKLDCFKTNNNLTSYEKQNQENDLIQQPPSSLCPISNNILDVNDNKTIEEFDTNSSDSAFESASEGETKILVEDLSKDNYIKMITSAVQQQKQQQHQSLSTSENTENSNENNGCKMQTQKHEEQQKQHQQNDCKCKSESIAINTKESINCNIIINNDSEHPIISSEIRNRSLSSDSLSSDNSLDLSTDNSQLSKMNEKLTKNDTLTRQKHCDDYLISNKKPRGLQALILWNNDITKDSSECISDLLDSTTSLELLNIGKNILSNDFLRRIKTSLQRNTTITNFGLQSTHLNSDGIKILAEILEFGGNNTLQRIDIRDNNIQVEGLTALSDALKSNNTVTRIDIDDIPKRIPEDGNETQFHYSRMLHNIRSLCSRNQRSQEMPPATTSSSNNINSTNTKMSRNYMSSRKISLTCQSLRTPLPDVLIKNELGLSDTVRKRSGTRLRSPLPSPPTISPSSSPVPSPSRNRFQVFRVIEKPNTTTTTATQSGEIANNVTKETPSPPSFMKEASSTTTRLSRFRITMVESSPPPVKPTEIKQTPPTPPPSPSNLLVTTHENKSTKNEEEHNNSTNSEKNAETTIEDNVDMTANNEQFFTNLDRKVTPTIPETNNVEIQTIEETNNENEIINTDSKDDENIKVQETSVNENVSENPTEKPNECLPIEQSTSSTTSLVINEEKETESENSTQSLLKEALNITPNETTLKHDTNSKSTTETTSENRTRRVSWISSGNYPATVDRLLNLFQHPGNLFSRSASPDNDKKIDNDHEIPHSQSLIPLRKQSPPSLFQWHKAQTGGGIGGGSVGGGEIKRISSDNMISANLQSYVRGIADFGKQVFKQNVPFMDTISNDIQQQQDCKSIPSDIKMEIKENISPEHTVTKNSIVSFQSVVNNPTHHQEMLMMIDKKSGRGLDLSELPDDKKTDNVVTTSITEATDYLCTSAVKQRQQQQQQQQQQQHVGTCDVGNEKQ